MSEKSPTIAVFLSFLFTGIGLIYLGNKTKGLMIFGIGVLCNILGMVVLGFFHYLSILTWILGMYITYKDSKNVKPEPVSYQYTRKVRHDRDTNRHYGPEYDMHNRPEGHYGSPDLERRPNYDYDRQHARDFDRHSGPDYDRHHGRDFDRHSGPDYDRQYGRDFDGHHDPDYKRQHASGRSKHHNFDYEGYNDYDRRRNDDGRYK